MISRADPVLVNRTTALLPPLIRGGCRARSSAPRPAGILSLDQNRECQRAVNVVLIGGFYASTAAEGERMKGFQPESSYGARVGAARDDIPEYVPSIGTRDIFRKLIADELRCGRLTRSQRQRIVQYGTGMGLSAVQMGRLITECREEVLQSRDETERYHALRLIEPPPPLIPTHVKIWLVLAAAIVIDIALVLALC